MSKEIKLYIEPIEDPNIYKFIKDMLEVRFIPFIKCGFRDLLYSITDIPMVIRRTIYGYRVEAQSYDKIYSPKTSLTFIDEKNDADFVVNVNEPLIINRYNRSHTHFEKARVDISLLEQVRFDMSYILIHPKIDIYRLSSMLIDQSIEEIISESLKEIKRHTYSDIFDLESLSEIIYENCPYEDLIYNQISSAIDIKRRGSISIEIQNAIKNIALAMKVHIEYNLKKITNVTILSHYKQPKIIDLINYKNIMDFIDKPHSFVDKIEIKVEI